MGDNLHFRYICLTWKCPSELPAGTPLYADYGYAGRSARQPHRNIATSHESVKGCTSITHMQKRARRAVSMKTIRGLHIQGNMAYPFVETPRFARAEDNCTPRLTVRRTPWSITPRMSGRIGLSGLRLARLPRLDTIIANWGSCGKG